MDTINKDKLSSVRNESAEPRESQSSQESHAHLAARHFRTGARLLLILALLATLLALFFRPEAAYLAAIPIPVLYAVLAITKYLVVRSEASHAAARQVTAAEQEDVERDVETVGLVTLLNVLGMLAIGTFIIAASFFELRLVGIVATGLFLLALLINLPYLPLFLSESEREERAKLNHREFDES